MSATNPELSIVIPAFNEELRLPATLEHIAAYLKNSHREAEVLVVDFVAQFLLPLLQVRDGNCPLNLVARHLIDQLPQPPSGMKWAYDRNTGKVDVRPATAMQKANIAT